MFYITDRPLRIPSLKSDQPDPREQTVIVQDVSAPAPPRRLFSGEVGRLHLAEEEDFMAPVRHSATSENQPPERQRRATSVPPVTEDCQSCWEDGYDEGAARSWQPIATAPQDGTRVIVSDPGWSVIVARTLPQWSEWYSVPGKYHVNPTHWMPAPLEHGVDGGHADQHGLTKPANHDPDLLTSLREMVSGYSGMGDNDFWSPEMRARVARARAALAKAEAR